ncbi:hypothetical protein [Kurthia huakuii]|uniref:hypothetical protein n=1 Tax=Kurthia huakuii TaxID=1421019 RepID=UPI000496B21E|nr:hypothetical protein [Kurthia huakuii]MBM7700057.1 gas vesicle protein [Kurthia huakuii]
MANKLVAGIALGAVAGAVISLLDRQTRQETTQKLKSASANVQYYAANRDELKDNLLAKVEAIQTAYNRIAEDKDYYLEKLEEVKALTPQVKAFVSDTKEAFAEEEAHTTSDDTAK